MEHARGKMDEHNPPGFPLVNLFTSFKERIARKVGGAYNACHAFDPCAPSLRNRSGYKYCATCCQGPVVTSSS
jgi:hypothetical protein